jgi:hypothetical protein
MVTMKDLVADTRRMTFGSLQDQINLVAQPYTANDTSLILDMDTAGITPGMVLASGLNVWYVKGGDAGTNTVFVIPGIDNSPSTAAEVGDMVFIKPRVTDWYLFNILNDEIQRMSSPEAGLYKIGQWQADVDPTYQTYVIPSEVFPVMSGIIRARYRMPGTEDVWIDIPNKAYKIQMDTSEGIIRLTRNVPSGTEIEFIYKASFTQASNLTDNVVTVCGLTASMTDIPMLGAYAKLLTTTESRRNQVQTQGDARRAGEVAAGSNLTSAQLAERNYQNRVNEEYVRLVSRNPILRSL